MKKISKNLKIFFRQIQFYRKLKVPVRIESEDAEKNVIKAWKKDYPVFSQVNKVDRTYDLMIIIPVYNTGEYLDECIQSVINQKSKYSFYIKIVNDGSTDNSKKILEHYSNKENIEIIHQENRGFSGARNRALEEIKGKYVMFLDSDDVLPQNSVELLMETAMINKADIVAGGYNTFNEKGNVCNYIFVDKIQKVLPREMQGFTCMKIIHSKLLENFCFPKDFLFEDTVISKLIYPKCENLYMIPDIVYSYRLRADSISQSYNKDKECIDTYWITKYCLDENIRRGYILGYEEYILYLNQCWANYMRTRYLSLELQESIFVLTCEMLKKCWKNIKDEEENRYKLLDKAIKRKSFLAYSYVLEHWENL